MIIGHYNTKAGTHTRSGALYRAGLDTRIPITGSNYIIYGYTGQWYHLSRVWHHTGTVIVVFLLSYMGKQVRDTKGWYLHRDGLHTGMGLIQINITISGYTDREYWCWHSFTAGYRTDVMNVGHFNTKVGTHTRSGALYRAELHTR